MREEKKKRKNHAPPRGYPCKREKKVSLLTWVTFLFLFFFFFFSSVLEPCSGRATVVWDQSICGIDPLTKLSRRPTLCESDRGRCCAVASFVYLATVVGRFRERPPERYGDSARPVWRQFGPSVANIRLVRYYAFGPFSLFYRAKFSLSVSRNARANNDQRESQQFYMEISLAFLRTIKSAHCSTVSPRLCVARTLKVSTDSSSIFLPKIRDRLSDPLVRFYSTSLSARYKIQGGDKVTVEVTRRMFRKFEGIYFTEFSPVSGLVLKDNGSLFDLDSPF